MRAVNLLPPERRRERVAFKPTKLHIAGAAGLAVAGGLFIWGHSLHGQVADQRTKAEALSARETTLNGQLVAARQTAAQGGSYEQTKALVAGIAQARINWGTVIGNVATVAPRQVWLTNLSVETPQGTPSATTPGTAAAAAAAAQAPTAIHMDGGAFTRDQVARMMVRLQAVPGLGEPKLTTVDVVKATTGTSRDSLKFSLDIPINQRILGARVQPGASYPSTATTPTP
jgi:Tfp pilus assembly protein PilN